MTAIILIFAVGCFLVLAWGWETGNPQNGMRRHDDDYNPFNG